MRCEKNEYRHPGWYRTNHRLEDDTLESHDCRELKAIGTKIAVFLAVLFSPLTLYGQPTRVAPLDNVQLLIDKLRASGLDKKGEFESSEEYQKRIASAFGDKTEFSFPVDAKKAIFLYDADHQQWTVLVLSSRVDFIMQKMVGKSTMNLASKQFGRTEYPAQNSFGVTVTVTDTHVDDYGIVWEKSPFGLGSLRLMMPMAPTDAKNLKGHLQIVINCRALASTVNMSARFDKATLDSPFETWGDRYYLNVEINSADVIDDHSGQVLQHFP